MSLKSMVYVRNAAPDEARRTCHYSATRNSAQGGFQGGAVANVPGALNSPPRAEAERHEPGTNCEYSVNTVLQFHYNDGNLLLVLLTSGSPASRRAGAKVAVICARLPSFCLFSVSRYSFLRPPLPKPKTQPLF